MELGTNFAAKLEPFLLISKSAKGAAAAKLVQDATSAPGVFVFAELLELPNIQEVCRVVCSNASPLSALVTPACHKRAACAFSLSSPAFLVSYL